jgi:hypothetical protein
MTYTNNLTGVEFETHEELVEDLIENYIIMQRDRYVITAAESDLVAELQRLAEESHTQSDSNTKVRTLSGTSQRVKLTPRTNVTYGKTDEGKSGLEELYGLYPQHMDALVRVDYKERPSQVEKFISDTENVPDVDPVHLDLAKRLSEYRQVKNGKPAIKVETL